MIPKDPVQGFNQNYTTPIAQTSSTANLMTPAHDNETVEPLVGMMQMLLAMMLLPLMDACAKTLGSHFPVGALAWWRFTVQLALVVPILLVIRRWDFRPDIALGQMLPGIVIASATICFFQALQHMTMAKAITIVFVSPMLQTLLSALLLGERPRIRRLLALAVGFAGVLIVIRPPTNAQFELVTLLPLGTAVAFAIYTLMLRHGARYKVHPLMTCAYIGFGGSISTTIPLATSAMICVGSALFSFPIPSLEQIPLILTIGQFAIP